ncbi:mechanosensitive ion channel domain-containing protein [Candidatus Nanohalococcus occultus]|uniref:Small-conductance mechanosensitive channel n=1 Tax=Candidatus Nanohalococcus occultus TaxID=2978047 RepID=A0ABY8CF84_9ARCH|nr:Small-conductance mechanosensitive channel [Candidatus Nanohaloarchaeota archaeon SVXNc]
MADFLTAILGLELANDVFTRVLVSLIILVVGHLGVRLSKVLAKKLWIAPKEFSKKEVEDRLETVQYTGYILDAGVITAALLYLNKGLTSNLSSDLADSLPELMSVILIGVLGFIAINLSIKAGKEFFEAIGTTAYFKEIGMTENTLDIIAGAVKAFLYLILLQILLNQLSVGDTFIAELVTASSWAFALMLAALLFWGLKDLFTNTAAGLYLKNSRMVRPGEEVKLGDETGEIKKVSLFSTEVTTDKGYTLLKPNKAIMDSEIRFKRTKNDLETLEDIKSYFVSQSGEGSGPAVMEMALDVFGYQASQERLAKDAEDRESLMQAVENVTNNEVKTGYVEKEKITKLGDELKAWFNDGALVAITLDKEEVIPEGEGRYILGIGVEENEVLIIDPSRSSGGVYFIEQSNLIEAMTDDDGYTVVAPNGTTAYWRIKKDLLYSDKTYYDELSKTLEARLNKMIRQGRIMKQVMPSSVREYVDDWRSGKYASRVWKPTGGENETSEDE